MTQTTFPSTLSESYGYDAVGNLTSKIDRKNQTIQYVYDALNRLTTVTDPAGRHLNFTYGTGGKPGANRGQTGRFLILDRQGRRIQKSGPAGTTIYLCDGANVVTDLNAAGAVVASYA